MSHAYAQHVLKVAVAQICQTIGWHSTHTSTMDLLIDVTQHFLREISRIMHRYCELYNRTEANLDDLALAYKEIGINLDELMEYIQFVDPIPLPLEVPRFPLPKESSLNFLKPGSREVLTRPVHIPEYMPPLMFESEEDGAGAASAAMAGGSEEDRVLVGGIADAKSLLNSAALALAAAAAMSAGEGRALTDGGGGSAEISIGGNVDDGSILPHAVINEEVEIPMQTIEVKEQTEVTATTPITGTTSMTTTVDETTEESAPEGVKRPETVVSKDKPTAGEEPPSVVTPGAKPAIVTEEGRPTREISSVIMTTSGFISPAREGKLPESRIPIIPEERPIPAPAPPISTMPAAPHHPLGGGVPAGAPAAVGSSTLSASAPVSSAALLASAASTSYFPKPTDGGLLAPGGTLGGSTIGAVPHDPVLPPPPLPPPTKPAGEKSAKKVKKKPVDKEKKKSEKSLANASRKLDKHVGGEKGALMKPPPPPPLEPTVSGTIFESAVKEEKVFPAPLPGEMPATPFPPPHGSRENLVFNPFAKEGGMVVPPIKPEMNEMVGGGMSLTATPTGKPAKPTKTKVVKEKPAKKRKSAAPKLPPGELGLEQQLQLPGSLFPGQLLPPPMANLLPPVMPQPNPSPKPKKVSRKKAANQQRGQHQDVGALPPPLIGPLGLGTSPLVGPGGNHPDGLFGMMQNAPTTAALSLPLKKPPSSMGSFKQEDRPEALPTPHSHMAADQVAQLNLLQMMHPSLEITASPAILSQDAQQKSHKAPFQGKGMKSDTSSDRDVIVIDDDKTPPHVSPMLSPGGAGVSTTPLATPTTTKKQRKQAAQNAAATGAASDYHLGANMMGYAGGSKMHPQQPFPAGPGSNTFEGGEFRHSDDPHGLQFSPTGVPKTPDIKLQHSSSSSTPSWMSESPRLTTPKKGTTTTTGNLFSELSSKALSEGMVPNKALDIGGAPIPPAAETGKKPKRPKQKPKNTEAKRAKLDEGAKKMGQLPLTGQPDLAGGSKNPFSLYPGGINPFAPDAASAYSKYLSQVAGLPRMPFGMFPLPSGPGLIPDNPLFPRLPPTYPGQPRPGFQMPPNPFGLPPGMNPMNNLLRMPGLANRLPGLGGGLGGNQRDFLDEPLDPETKLAQTPLDLQKSTCNVAPLVPPSLFQSATESIALGDAGSNELLNLSVKSTGAPSVSKETITTAQSTISSKKETTLTISGATSSGVVGGSAAPAASSFASQPLFSSSVSASVKDTSSGRTETMMRESSYKEDQVVILPAASFLPGASPPQRSNLLVIDIDDSDGSQSTATTGGKSKDGKRKQKEHKKDRKQKDGKIKKKKDKKDKSKSKDRDREQLKELTAGTATAPGMMTMGMIGAEEALMEQLRKERKEKKEKRKEKLKKEKRKEKEGRAGGPAGAGPSAGTQPAGEMGLKLMLKIGGSNATQSPRSETPEQLATTGASSSQEPRRDGSPELARISALVTRPPKLKGNTTPGSKGKKDDVASKNVPLSSPGGSLEHSKLQPSTEPDDAFAALKQSTKVNLASGAVGAAATTATLTNYATVDEGAMAGSSATGRASKAARMADGLMDTGVKALGGAVSGSGESSKKATKESKSSKSVHHHHHAAADTYNTTPVHMTDVDGNTVWICPACGRVDDGTPMIGCDGCDAWYHWVCVGIQVPPDDNEDWYCRVCIAKKQDSQADEKQRKRKKKDKKTSKD
uniref:PHD-type domain-containing protein n=1 Tax=Anopheles christyi TaxID=43041 RepID=A0A182K466_9DIPT